MITILLLGLFSLHLQIFQMDRYFHMCVFAPTVVVVSFRSNENHLRSLRDATAELIECCSSVKPTVGTNGYFSGVLT